MSTPLRPPSEPERRRSSFTIILAMIGLFVAAGLLLVLPTGFIGPVMVFGGMIFFGIIGFHYLVWGRWLSRVLREEIEDEAA